MNGLAAFLSIGLGIQTMLGAMLLYLFSNVVIILRDVAMNTQKVETGEDYKAARFVADIMVFVSIGGFLLGLIIVIKSL
ncbi:MAG: hypothetical protein M0Z61_05280 [Nitrospiraceae bacterium]|nr:hypothetical protein [Nitrospiraceae bacterium]